MKTPRAVMSVVIVEADAERNVIVLEADEDVLSAIRDLEMGIVRFDKQRGKHVLTVSQRFSFQEVRDWLLEQAA